MMSKKKSIFQPSKALFGFQSLLGACGIAVCSALDWSPGSHYLANIVGLILSCLIMLVGFGLFLTLQTMTKLPSNNPSSFIAKSVKNMGSKKTKIPLLACVGDSLTHGRASANFVQFVETSFNKGKNKKLEVVNAGRNSICTLPLLKLMIPEVIECHPEYVCILIGTNDIKGVYNAEWGDKSVDLWNLPDELSFDTYEINLGKILDEFLHKTKANIGVCTLPPMGENLKCKANDFVEKANLIIKKVVKTHERSKRVTIIDISQKLKSEITTKKIDLFSSHSVDDFQSAMKSMSILRVIFRFSWNKLGSRVGNIVSTIRRYFSLNHTYTYFGHYHGCL